MAFKDLYFFILLGMQMSTFTNIYFADVLSLQNEVEMFLSTRLNFTSCTTCTEKVVYDGNVVNYLIDNHYFQHKMLEIISQSWPFWINIKPGNGTVTLPENVQANAGLGKRVIQQKPCSNLPLSPNNLYVSYLPKMPINLQFFSFEKRLPTSMDAHCFAVDMCENKIHIAFPRSQPLDFTPNIVASGVRNFKLKATRLTSIEKPSCFHYKELKHAGCVKSRVMMEVKGQLTTKSAFFDFDGVLGVDSDSIQKVCLLILVIGLVDNSYGI